MLEPAGAMTFGERLNYYYGQDTWVRFVLAYYYIELIVLNGLAAYFHGGDRVFVNERGVAAVMKDHPDLAARYAL